MVLEFAPQMPPITITDGIYSFLCAKRQSNIRLTGNPRLAWFLPQLLSRNHDRPDCPVEAIVRFLHIIEIDIA